MVANVRLKIVKSRVVKDIEIPDGQRCCPRSVSDI